MARRNGDLVDRAVFTYEVDFPDFDGRKHSNDRENDSNLYE